MRIIFIILIALLPTGLMANDKILTYFGGLPIMNGFYISNDDIMVFDKPEGQITEVVLWCDTGCSNRDVIMTYYKNALSSLGWVSRSDTVFTKDNQNLSFNIFTDETSNSVILLFRSTR